MPTEAATTSKGMLWTGRILSGVIVALFLTLAISGFFNPEMSRKGMHDMGYPESVGMPITIAFITSIVLYAIPRTSVLGAILMTGYLGGAIATHVRLQQSIFVAPAVIAILVWLGIYLRDSRLRAILPLRS